MSMITYLKDGWYTRLGQRRLRNEVVDGAIDTASMFFRAAVPPQAITSLALKIRALATIADPPHRRAMGGVSAFGEHERSALVQRLQMYTDRFPALQSFINDCLEHVADANELRALYLHLVHVTQMLQLLIVAKLSGAGGGLGFLGASLGAAQNAGSESGLLSSVLGASTPTSAAESRTKRQPSPKKSKAKKKAGPTAKKATAKKKAGTAAKKSKAKKVTAKKKASGSKKAARKR